MTSVRRLSCWLGLLAALAISSIAHSQSTVAAKDETGGAGIDDVQDLLLLGPTHPVRIRLHVETGGVKFREVWRKAVESSFDRYDGAKRGHITAEQAGQLFAFFAQGLAARGNLPAVDPSAMAMMKGRAELSRADVLARAEQIAPPFTVRHRLASQGAGPALFSLLDPTGDGRLSPTALNVAEQSLRCRDFNDDGLISPDELLRGPSLTGESQPAAAAKGSVVIDGPVIALSSSTPPDSLVEILLMRYDRNRDGRLSSAGSPVEIRSPTNAYARFDVDQNQALDRAELVALLHSPPEIEMSFQFGRPGTASRSSERAGADAAAAYRLRRKLDGGYRLTVAENEIDFRRNNRDPAKANQAPRLSDYDQNKDDALTAEELTASGLATNLAQVDGDGNGKVSSEEFDAYFNWQASLASAQLVLEVSDEGQDLFALLDRNADGFLSPRELKTSATILSSEDADHDGYLTASDIPYRVMLELSRGGPNASNNAARMTAMRQPRPAKSGAAPPDWFAKMDRNGDGDISPAEFLGSRAQFDKLDQNHDGLLDAADAAASERR